MVGVGGRDFGHAVIALWLKAHRYAAQRRAFERPIAVANINRAGARLVVILVFAILAVAARSKFKHVTGADIGGDFSLSSKGEA